MPVGKIAEEIWETFVVRQKKKTFAAFRRFIKLYHNQLVPWEHVQKSLRQWWEFHKELNLITEREPFDLWDEEVNGGEVQ